MNMRLTTGSLLSTRPVRAAVCWVVRALARERISITVFWSEGSSRLSPSSSAPSSFSSPSSWAAAASVESEAEAESAPDAIRIILSTSLAPSFVRTYSSYATKRRPSCAPTSTLRVWARSGAIMLLRESSATIPRSCACTILVGVLVGGPSSSSSLSSSLSSSSSSSLPSVVSSSSSSSSPLHTIVCIEPCSTCFQVSLLLRSRLQQSSSGTLVSPISVTPPNMNRELPLMSREGLMRGQGSVSAAK
mmetsp:Transcript_8974/g.19581  ORF Transcript_8974/g.19581 Transcript_8974/m.19581 type:complete len:247 (-) Transcript_8974:24-764(-)